MGDMQISAEYVAYSIHEISRLAGGAQTAIVTHSQGGPLTQWALRFWPSIQSITRAFVALSPDFAGIEFLGSRLSDVCVGDLCQASLWQQSEGSNFLAALHADAFRALVPSTAIWTSSDGIVMPPQPNALLPAAAVLQVQSLCPLRIVTHVQMPTDSAAFALALDALNHGGVGSVSRARGESPLACFHMMGPSMSTSVQAELASTYNSVVNGLL